MGDGARLPDIRRNLAEVVIQNRAMINLRPCVFAEPDEHHLHQPALHLADEVRVRFDSPTNHHVIRSEGVFVKVDGKTFRRLADDHGFHTGANRAAAKIFRNAVRFDHFALPFRRSAAVAAHRRHDERLRSELFQVRDSRSQNDVNVRDAAAPRRDRDGLAGPDFLAQFQLSQLSLHFTRNVGDARQLSAR